MNVLRSGTPHRELERHGGRKEHNKGVPDINGKLMVMSDVPKKQKAKSFL